MTDLIDDIALPRGQWVALTPHGPTPHFRMMNKGEADVLVKKGGAAAPEHGRGAMPVGPGRMLPPEDLTLHGLQVWALSPSRDGLVAVEALGA